MPAVITADIQTALLEPGDRRWTDTLDRLPHDVYHLPAYCDFLGRQDNARAIALYATVGSTECLVPLTCRQLPAWLGADARYVDAASPYGYGAPCFTPGAPDEERRAALAACIREAGRHDIVTIFLRLHPLLSTGERTLGEAGLLVRHGETVWVDLRRTEEQLAADMSTTSRYEVRRLQRLSFRVSFDQWEHLSSFGELYRETMRRVGADPSYLFPESYFQGLHDALGRRLHLALVVDPEGQIAAGALFTEQHGLLQYHLSGSAKEFSRLAPTKLLLSAIIGWGRERSHERLHLGGGVGGKDDSLFRFKAGFSPLRAEFHTCRVVSNAPVYSMLTAEWSAAAGMPASGMHEFFPAYRRPIPGGTSLPEGSVPPPSD